MEKDVKKKKPDAVAEINDSVHRFLRGEDSDSDSDSDEDSDRDVGIVGMHFHPNEIKETGLPSSDPQPQRFPPGDWHAPPNEVISVPPGLPEATTTNDITRPPADMVPLPPGLWQGTHKAAETPESDSGWHHMPLCTDAEMEESSSGQHHIAQLTDAKVKEPDSGPHIAQLTDVEMKESDCGHHTAQFTDAEMNKSDSGGSSTREDDWKDWKDWKHRQDWQDRHDWQDKQHWQDWQKWQGPDKEPGGWERDDHSSKDYSENQCEGRQWSKDDRWKGWRQDNSWSADESWQDGSWSNNAGQRWKEKGSQEEEKEELDEDFSICEALERLITSHGSALPGTAFEELYRQHPAYKEQVKARGGPKKFVEHHRDRFEWKSGPDGPPGGSVVLNEWCYWEEWDKVAAAGRGRAIGAGTKGINREEAYPIACASGATWKSWSQRPIGAPSDYEDDWREWYDEWYNNRDVKWKSWWRDQDGPPSDRYSSDSATAAGPRENADDESEAAEVFDLLLETLNHHNGKMLASKVLIEVRQWYPSKLDMVNKHLELAGGLKKYVSSQEQLEWLLMGKEGGETIRLISRSARTPRAIKEVIDRHGGELLASKVFLELRHRLALQDYERIRKEVEEGGGLKKLVLLYPEYFEWRPSEEVGKEMMCTRRAARPAGEWQAGNDQ
eukprot:TRINITY_DN5322_c0_g1_i1.p1 TRINITY_DN5322_c0_g1~~TRINITY_DN5322_c0_g1_i1.p1  ORF type:complete len:668 (+),score=150.05 TRINITY_DN5322_c0_g1_i1:120-2123(+)